MWIINADIDIFPARDEIHPWKKYIKKKKILTELILNIPVTGVLFVTQQHILDVGLLLNKQ